MVEWRKYITQMTKWEIKRIRDTIDENKFNYTPYAQNRLLSRKIKDEYVQRVIKYGDIIEFHFKDGDARVLLRGREIAEGYTICVVLSLSKRNITTVYRNKYEDKHFTLQKELYNGKIDLMRYIKVS